MKLLENKGFVLGGSMLMGITMIGMVALIAIPNVVGIRERSQVSADKRMAEQIGKAVRIWATDVEMGEVRDIPTTAVKYDEIDGLTNLYMSSGYEATSLETGTGYYYVTSFNEYEQKIMVAIAESAEKTNDLEGNEVTYDGSKAAWAYVEK